MLCLLLEKRKYRNEGMNTRMRTVKKTQNFKLKEKHSSIGNRATRNETVWSYSSRFHEQYNKINMDNSAPNKFLESMKKRPKTKLDAKTYLESM